MAKAEHVVEVHVMVCYKVELKAGMSGQYRIDVSTTTRQASSHVDSKGSS